MQKGTLKMDTITEEYPLTSYQKDIWMKQNIYPERPFFNIGGCIEVQGEVDYDTLCKALNIVIDKNDTLRIIMGEREGEPFQKFLSHLDYKIELHDFSKYEDSLTYSIEWQRKELTKAFNINGNIMFKVVLIKTGEGINHILLKFHHLIIDGWGISLFHKRFIDTYNYLMGGLEQYESESFSYVAFIDEHKIYLKSEAYKKSIEFWREKLGNLQERLITRKDKTLDNQIITSDRKLVTIRRELYNKLEELAKSVNCSLFHLFLGGLAIYFGKVYNKDEIVIAVPILNRSNAKAKKTMGLFVNQIPLRIKVDGTIKFTDLLINIRNDLKECYRHQKMPFGEMLRAANINNERIYEVILSYEKHDFESEVMGNPTGSITYTHQSEINALAVFIREFIEDEYVEIDFDYQTEIFDEDFPIENMVRHFQNILDEVIEVSNEYVAISKAEEKEFYKASSAEKRIYTAWEMDQFSAVYNVPMVLEIQEEIDSEKVKRILNELIRRHEALRTSFVVVNGEIVQKIEKQWEVDYEYEELNQDIKEKINSYIKPFDLTKAPLIRSKLIKCEEQRYILIIDVHHIVADGVSISILIKEFIQLYKGENLGEPALHYKDYSEWQATLAESQLMKKQEEYWANRLVGETPILDIIADFERPSMQSYQGKRLIFTIDKELNAKLNKVAKDTGTTLYMVLLAAYNVMLSRYSGQEDIIIGTVQAGRNREELKATIGMFVNTVALRNYPSREKSFREFLKELSDNTLRDFQNVDYQFGDLVNKLNVKKDASRNPLFDVMFVLENLDFGFSEDSFNVKLIEPEIETAKFDLTLTAVESKDGISFGLEYCSKLFKSETIERMAKHYINILTYISVNIESKIHEINIVSEAEKNKLLNEFNKTEVEYSREKTVVDIFEEQVANVPDNIAVVFEVKEITYRELNKKANQLAIKLRDLGVMPDDFVAVMAEKSVEAIVAICGIIKAGAAYVPMDSTYPKERIDYMIKDCKPKALILYNVEYETDIPVIDIAEVMLWEGVEENLKVAKKPKELIYLIYTSGTTGKPKGVMVEHKNVIRLVHKASFVELNEKTVILKTGALSFDAATFEIWGALLNGGELHIANNDYILEIKILKRTIEQKGINLMWLTSVLFNQLVNLDVTVFNKLKTLIIGGEKLSEAHIRKLLEFNKNINLINGYGPTETTTFATTYLINSGDLRAKTPIGRPISNTKIYVLNGTKLCGIGIPGELCITGDGVARGYLNLSELTVEKFIDNPFGEGKMYRSGDFARWLPDGNLEFLGRIDKQIKLRGFRIELGEIEAVIRKITGVQDVAVIIIEENEEKYICAYLVAEEATDIDSIHKEIIKELPEYMVPTLIMQLEKLPITSNGKLDKGALPKIEIKNKREYVAPRNKLEKDILKVFEEVQYSQEEITGEVPLTPIQKNFFKWNLFKPNHFNQSVMLMAREGFNEKAIKEALTAIVKHHDILRAVFVSGKQEILSINDSTMFQFKKHDLRYFNSESIEETVEYENTKLQSSFDLATGPLVKAALYQTVDGDHLMICIHHLVVDGVSWRILIEDFETGYNQYLDNKNIIFPRKVTSYKEWASELIEYGKSEKIKNEIAYWEKINKELIYGKIANNSSGKELGYGKISFILGEEKTSILLHGVGKVYDTEINDILLGSLVMAYKLWRGKKKLVLKLEGHGREEINEKIHIDRTVGWFTSIFPIVLDAGETIEESIINTKEMLRNIPQHGVGYNLIKQSGLCEMSETEVDISFNYLGEFTVEKSSIGKLEKSPLSRGRDIAKDNIFSNIILNGSVTDGKFNMEVWFDKGKYSQRAIEELVKCYEGMLKQVIEQSDNSDARFLSKEKDRNVANATSHDLQVCARSIFVLKKYDVSNFKNTKLFRELICYDENTIDSMPTCFEPFAYQKFFMVEAIEEICCARIDILGTIAKKNIIDIIKETIKEQSIFRMSYDKDSNYLQQYDYKDSWYVPYMDISSDNIDEKLEVLESVINIPELFEDNRLLAKIVIAKVSKTKHYIYFYVQHGLWDITSTEILEEIIKAKCLGIAKMGKENIYTDYTKDRKALESKLKKDSEDFADKFFKQVKSYKVLMKGDEPKYSVYIKYKFRSDILEKILENPMAWVAKLFSLINLDEPRTDLDASIPLLLLHFGREGVGLKTLGMYLDLIPHRFNVNTGVLTSCENSQDKGNYTYALVDKTNYNSELNNKHFEIIPVINFHVDMDIEKVFEDFGEYDIQVKDIEEKNIETLFKCLITMRIYNDMIYLVMPSVSNDMELISRVIEEYLGLALA